MTLKRLFYIVLGILLIAVVALLVSQPMRTRGDVVFQTEAPMIVPAEGMTVYEDNGKITRVHGRVRFRKLGTTSRATTGPCYRIDARVIGDNGLIDEIVVGTGHYHWCVEAAHPNQLIDRYTYSSSDHHESWQWHLTNVDVVRGQGWSSTWCLNDGEQGPCFPVQYRYTRFVFRWDRGLSIFGQDIKMHKTLYVACTVRGNPGGHACSTGEWNG